MDDLNKENFSQTNDFDNHLRPKLFSDFSGQDNLRLKTQQLNPSCMMQG